MRIFIVFIGFVVVFSAAFPAAAVSKRELEAKIIQLEQRLIAMENRILTGDPAAERLMQRMDALESTARSMTGEVERLRYENSVLQEEVRALAAQISAMQATSADMQRHLKAVDIIAQDRIAQNQIAQDQLQNTPKANPEPGADIYGGGRSGGGVYAGGSSIPGPPTILGGGMEDLAGGAQNDTHAKLALIGLDKMNEGDFSGAQADFMQYLELNPSANDRGDVLFWLAETYYAKSGFSQAAENYIASMRAAPKGDYAPEAMVKLAATARSLGKKTMACQTLASFPTQYPKAVPAVREKARIEKLRSGC